MKTILTLSPHLDDAAFSVGPLLAELVADARIVVATVFTKSIANPEKFALACQLDKGLPATIDYMEMRRAEDLEWSQKIGAEAVHGPFAEAPHRGYRSITDLFGPILLDDDIENTLRAWLTDLTISLAPDMVLVPLGIGNHVDHQWVRKIAELAISSRYPLTYFKDQPYSEKSNEVSLYTHLSAGGSYRELHAAFSSTSVDRALSASESYKTQIPFQFGGMDLMKQLLTNAWKQKITLFSFHRELQCH